MVPLLWLIACVPVFPEAFDWRIDRTLVPGIRHTGTRIASDITVEALVLSPWAVEEVAIDLCGVQPDGPGFVDAVCYSEPSLVEQVATGLPATFRLPELAYTCTSSDTGLGGFCGTTLPLRVRVRTAEDEGSGIVYVSYFPDDSAPPYGVDDPPQLNPMLFDLQVNVLGGDVVAGGEVRLEASTAPELGDIVRWYVDDGELLSTGRTALTGASQSRRTSINTLRIPEDYQGPLRVAVLIDSGAVWTVRTLEVP